MTIRSELQKRKFSNLKRRITQIAAERGMRWNQYETVRLAKRVMYCSVHQGVDDIDLRVLIRMYNRELIGRLAHETTVPDLHSSPGDATGSDSKVSATQEMATELVQGLNDS